MIRLELFDRAGIAWAQTQVTAHHYLRRPADTRCSVEGYAVHLETVRLPEPAGLLLFGRPQATRFYPWYGSVEDVRTYRAVSTYWQVLNLARLWLDPRVQVGGCYYGPEYLPGFFDRRGVWRSRLASDVVKAAIGHIGYDYLMQRPPVFPEEPYDVDWLLSYCDTRLHRGVVYRAAGFERYSINDNGIETWRVLLPPLTEKQRRAILRRSAQDPRAIRYRAARAQLHLPGLPSDQESLAGCGQESVAGRDQERAQLRKDSVTCPS